eukprot:393043_1
MYLANTGWLLLSVVTTVLILWMSIDFISHENQNRKSGSKLWQKSPQKSLSVITFILLIIFGIHCTINAVYAVISEATNTFGPYWCLSSYIQLVWYTTSKIFLYLFYIVQLHLIFKNSPFAVPIKQLKALAIFVCIPVLINSCYGYYITAYIGFHLTDSRDLITLNTFKDCSTLDDIFYTKITRYLDYTRIAIYLLGELVYSIVLLRLFLSR